MADNPRIEDLRRRVQKDPATIAFAQLAEEYRRAGQHQDAVDVCGVGLALHPGYLSARVTLGRALIELGDLDRAQNELETVLKTASENLAAIRGMAEIHFKRGEFREALVFYRDALDLAPNDPDLEQTVADLTHRVMPGRRADAADGLSFDQMQQELSARLPPPPVRLVPAQDELPARQFDGGRARPIAPVAPPRAEAPMPAPRVSSADAVGGPPARAPVQLKRAEDPPAASHAVPPSEPDEARADRAIAALDQWLDAIHVTRAHTPS